MAGARPRTSTDVALAVVLVLECLGALGIALRDGRMLDQAGAGLALAAALVVALRGERRAAYVVAGWFLLAAVLKTATGTEPNSSLAIVSQAARYGVALAVAQPRVAGTLLRAAASLTFLGHGIQALCLQPIFVAYLQHTGGLVGLEVSNALAAGMLRVIGTVDVLVAIALVVPGERRWVAGYMGTWGIVTALARVVYGGPAGIADALVRAANGGAPLVLWLGGRGRSAARSPSKSEP